MLNHNRVLSAARWILAVSVLSFSSTWSSSSRCQAQALQDSPWGVAPSTALSYDPDAWIMDMQRIGVTSIRGFHDRPDGSGTAAAKKLGLSLSSAFFPTQRQPLTLPVDDLDGFRAYVKDMVSRYKDHVHHWEVWNEPPNFTQDTSPVSYGKIVAAAYEAAKSVDPKTKIGLCTKSTHINFLAESIRGGAKGKYDFITLHPYETVQLLVQGIDTPYFGILDNVRSMLRHEDPAHANVPIWFTELGIQTAEAGANTHDAVSEELQADTLVKVYALGIAQGVARIHWFDPRDSEGRSNGLERSDGTPRPAMHAYQVLTRALGPVPEFLGYTELSPKLFGTLFRHAGQLVLVAWAHSADAPDALPLSESVRTIDPRTGEARRVAEQVQLSAAPQVFSAPETSLSARRWKNATRREPANYQKTWNKSIALTAGEAPRGLYLLDAPQPKTVNGTAELDMAGTTGARFAVDPRFLGYDSQPIRITAVVRGHGQDRDHHDPGFNLKYESAAPLQQLDDSGMQGTGSWQSVLGTSPVTLTWDIAAPRFVGKYGINFLLDSDSPTFADFSLLSLTVTKLGKPAK